jgi:hydroxymethylbilane synthase
VGTRGSPLALLQAEVLLRALGRLGAEAEVVKVRTRADRFADRPIHELGTGVFVREIDDRVLSGELDAAVHSLKDVPTEIPEGLAIAAVLPRGLRHDLLLGPGRGGLKGLPRRAGVGTSSVRRRAQLLRARPDLEVRPIRGNIGTRLRRVEEGEYDATVLSAAALERLGTDPAPLRAEPLDPDLFVPAAGQGAVAVVARAGSEWCERLVALNDPAARAETDLEREVLRGVGAGCIAPVGVLARRSRAGRLRVAAEVLAADGSRAASFRGEVGAGPAGARRVVEALRRQGAEELIDEARKP